MKPIWMLLFGVVCVAAAYQVAAKRPPVAIPDGCEIVMTEGMSISLSSAGDELTVTAGPGVQRTFRWPSDARTVRMLPRDSRWYGSLGLFNAGAFVVRQGDKQEASGGINRILAEEGQRHFTSKADAEAWLRFTEQTSVMRYAYNDTGLVVGMEILRPSKERAQQGYPTTLSVEVWQIYIAGRKPVSLMGASNQKITAHYPANYDLQVVEAPDEPIDNYYQADELP